MSDLRINVDKTRSVAVQIKFCNTRIRAGLDDVQKAIEQLDSVWDGPAASNSIAKFNDIKNSLSDERYKVIDNYVNFLLSQVGEGYTQTEDVNKSLADAFK